MSEPEHRMRKVVLGAATAVVLIGLGLAAAWWLLGSEAPAGQEIGAKPPTHFSQESRPAVESPDTASRWGLSTQEYVLTRARTAGLGVPKRVGEQDRVDAFAVAAVEKNGFGGDDVRTLAARVLKDLTSARVLTRAQAVMLLDHDPADGVPDLWVGVPVLADAKVPDSLKVRTVGEGRVVVSEKLRLSDLAPDKLVELRRQADAAGKVRFPIVVRFTSPTWHSDPGNDAEVQVLYPVD